MPFGIIDTRQDGKLAGTELLIEEERASSSLASDEAPHLKRIMYKGESTVLVPQPSADNPNDPLLWPRWKKEAAFWVIFFNTIILGILPGPMLAPVTVALAGILSVPLTDIAVLSGYQLLVVGAIGPLVSVLAQKYGKRPQFLFASAMATVGTAICIAGSQRMHYPTLLGGRVVQGLGVTAWESLSVAAIGDMFYLHERGWRTSVMVAALACSASMVAIVSGVFVQNVGWKNLFVASLPIDIVCTLCTVFLIPETQFRRTDAPLHTHGAEHSSGEKGEGLQAEVTTPDAPGATIIPKKTYLQTLAPYSGEVYTNRNILHLLSEIFIHLLNPAVVWILLVSGVLIAFFVVTAYILAQIWSPPPYSLNVAQNGYFFTGGLVGGLLAAFVGPICDWSARAFTRMNKGVFEAEFRIPINILGSLMCGIGWFVFMWDMQTKHSNAVIVGSFCYGAACFGISVPSTSAGLYILDSFPKQSTEVFILQMMLKNFLFYGFSTFMNKWAASAGPAEIFKTFGIVSQVLIATSIPMYIFGKKNRSFMHRVHQKNKIFKAIG